MLRARPGVPATLLVAWLAVLGCAAGCADGGDRPGGGRVALLPDPARLAHEPSSGLPFEVQVLVEGGELEGPRSHAVNRFFDGWTPVRVRGREGFRASPEGATFRVVTLGPGDRRLVLDLLDDGRLSRLAHVDVRIDGGDRRRVPVLDPLSIRLPEDLAPGRHRVEIVPRRPDEPTLIVAAAQVRRRGPGPEDRAAGPTGGATLEDGALLQEGPSLLDVVAQPPKGISAPAISGRLCPAGLLAPAGGVSVEVAGAEGRSLGRWEGNDSLLDRLRGCRDFQVPLGARARGGDGPAGPVRVRLEVLEPGASVRWRELAWSGVPGPGGPARTSGGAAEARAGADRRPLPKLVVLYVPDALRADFVGHLGGPEGVSPTIDRLAEEGFTFRAHRSNAPNTLPSIRELFTGRIYLGQRAWDTIGRARPTLAEAFREAGYRTGLFSGNLYTSARYGLARGFDHVSEEALFEGTPEVNRNAEAVHAAALEWLRSLPPDEPVFLYAQTIHPHNPFAPPEALERRFTGGIDSEIRGDTAVLRAIQKGELRPGPADRERLRGLYAASVAYNDAELARFLAALEERFAPEETLVVVTSDHGEELFDHGGVLHGYTLYEELLRIPLVVWAPGRVRPGTTGAPTDMLDLHATLLDLVTPGRKLDPGASAGRSLLPLLAGGTDTLPHEPRYAATWGVPGGIFAVRDGPWKLIRVRGTPETWWMGVGPGRTRRREHLFDLASDPGERKNLAGSGTPREQWLRARLRAWMAEQEAAVRAALAARDGPAEDGSQPSLDDEARERLRALGYVD